MFIISFASMKQKTGSNAVKAYLMIQKTNSIKFHRSKITLQTIPPKKNHSLLKFHSFFSFSPKQNQHKKHEKIMSNKFASKIK